MSTNPFSSNRTANSGGLNSVAALFHDESRAERALQDLKREGFSETEIGIATSGRQLSPFWEKINKTLNRAKTQPESTSSIRESLQAVGMPEAQAKYFDSGITRGDIFISVRASGDRAAKARMVLDKIGADFGDGRTAMSAAAPSRPVAEGERDIQLIGEILRVHKETVQRGEVRLHKEVIAERQNVDVPVMHEEFVIERVRVDGKATPRSVLGEDNGEIRVPLMEEEAHLEKMPMVTEEVHIRKREVQETKHLSDTVRHEELRAEQQGNFTDAELKDLRDRQKKAA
jgi:uncharacterized protein (TIGR02271 family)